MRLLLFLLTCTLLGALALPARADLRCDRGIVRQGDRMAEVSLACGEPDVKVVLHSVLTAQAGFVPVEEEWQYNFGTQQFMRFLRFQNGRLSQVVTGPRGFSRHANPRCSPNDLGTGMSQLELLARCGEPDSVDTLITSAPVPRLAAGAPYPLGVPAEEWLYRFNSQQFMRFVMLVNGRVVAVESSRFRD